MAKKLIITTCPECAGKQFIPKGHVTRKRNRRQCPTCAGVGELHKHIVVPSKDS